jgi:hypothetical protein
MTKNDIKKLLRESIFELDEVSDKALKAKAKKKSKDKPNSSNDDDYERLSSDEKEKLDTQTIEIRTSVGPGKPFKYTQILISAGILNANADDVEKDTIVSKYRREILNKKEKVNGVNVVRRLTLKDADRLYNVIKNPGATK